VKTKIITAILLILSIPVSIWLAQYSIDYVFQNKHGGYKERQIEEFKSYLEYVNGTIVYCEGRIDVYAKFSKAGEYRYEGFYLGDFGLGSKDWLDKFENERAGDEARLSHRSSVYRNPEVVNGIYLTSFESALKEFESSINEIHQAGKSHNRRSALDGLEGLKEALTMMRKVKSGLEEMDIIKYLPS